MSARTLNRREMIGLLGAAAIPAVYGADFPVVHVKLIEHVAMTVSNIDKAMMFYRRLFGNDVIKDNKSSTRFLRMGPCYLEISQAASGEASRITRFGASVENFRAASLKSNLIKVGIPVKESAMGQSLLIRMEPYLSLGRRIPGSYSVTPRQNLALVHPCFNLGECNTWLFFPPT